MRRYQPTNDEENALFVIMPSAYDVIQINNDYFYDEETTDEERKQIVKMSKDLYKSALKMHETLKLSIFG